jgi:hypothetical protein
MRLKTDAKILSFLLILVIFIGLIPQGTFASGNSPSLSKYTVTPRRGIPEIEYLFTATYTDSDNDPPAFISVFVDQIEYEMEEVDPTDSNYTDGKDYFVKQVLGKGTYTFYYKADDGNGNEVTTRSFTLDVAWEVGHYDLIHYFEDEVLPGITLIMALFILLVIVVCVIMVLMVLQLRRIRKVLEEKGSEEVLKKDEEGSNLTQ